MFTFLKGIVIGIGKILPGISGSLIAISFGIYDKLISIVDELKIKQNIVFLVKICSGITIGIIFGSKIMSFFLNNYYSYTISVVAGILIYITCNIYKKEKPVGKKDWLYVFFSFAFVYLVDKIDFINMETNNYILVILLGFIDALTMIVPGISGTAIFTMLGVYPFFLSILSNIFNKYILFFGFGLIIGVFITTKIVAYFLRNHHKTFYLLVLGFSMSSLLAITKLININLISLFFIIIGFLFGLFFDYDR